MNEQEKRKINEAVASCLSGVEALPSMRAEILRAAKGEQKVKHSMNKGLVLALILVLLSTTVAVAAEWGLFGLIGQQENADVRLPALDTVATPVGQVFNTPEGVTVTIDQAYYDGSRVFISYKLEGPHDVLQTGTGKPDLVNYDQKYDNVLYRDMWYADSPNGQEMMAWLDGSEARWATRTSVNVHDGMQIGEEYLDIIGGEYYYLEDGSLMSWKECLVPAELAADEVTFSIGTFTVSHTYYQTPEALYTFGADISETTWHDFTVKKDLRSSELTGSLQTMEWSAEANLTRSAIDIKGEIVVKGPEGWTDIWQSWENPDKLDYINDWKLYADGVKAEGYNLDGGVRAMEDGKVSFGICYKLTGENQDIQLVPVYRYAGEKPEEAIRLTAK